MEKLDIGYEILKNVINNKKLYYVENEDNYEFVVVTQDIIYFSRIDRFVDEEYINDFETNLKNDAIKVESIDAGIALGYNNL